MAMASLSWLPLVEYCNVPPPWGRARLHLVAFLGHSQPPQTNNSLFCTLCPHSCAPGKYYPVGHPSLNFSRPNTLKFRVFWRWASGKEVATCWYESPINSIKPWAGCYILTPLRDLRPRRSTQARNVPSWPRPCIQCQRICHAVWQLRIHTSHPHHACATATHAPVKPRGLALIPFCNVPPPRGRARLHLGAFLGHSQPPQTNTSLFCTLCPHSCVPPPRGRAPLHLAVFLRHSQPPQTNTSLFCILCPHSCAPGKWPPQTNTSLFCTLCPHSCAPGKYFPVSHPSLNFSRPSTLNFRVLWRWASGKEVATCWYESPINPIKP